MSTYHAGTSASWGALFMATDVVGAAAQKGCHTGAAFRWQAKAYNETEAQCRYNLMHLYICGQLIESPVNDAVQ